ncbi:MAG: class I SAM-dependent methyltransferase [Polyangiaceae bacterium]
MNAELYALTHRGNAGDVAFYQRVCRGAQRVLELGSGYGRVLGALAQADRQLIGLERDPEFIALAKRNLRKLPAPKRRAIRLLRGDMRNFALPAPVQRVLLPYNALYCLVTKTDALACFRAARRALVAGGVLALDVWNAAQFHGSVSVHDPAQEREPIVTLRHAGHTYDVFERSRVRRAQQRLDVAYEYVPRSGGSRCEIPIAQRYYLAEEIDALLARSGFALQARYGEFSGRRFNSRSAQLIVLARAI